MTFLHCTFEFFCCVTWHKSNI